MSKYNNTWKTLRGQAHAHIGGAMIASNIVEVENASLPPEEPIRIWVDSEGYQHVAILGTCKHCGSLERCDAIICNCACPRSKTEITCKKCLYAIVCSICQCCDVIPPEYPWNLDE